MRPASTALMAAPARWRGGLLALTLSAALCFVGPAGSSADTTVSGASLATCSPSSCLPADGVKSVTLPSVSNDDGTYSPREYQVYRPRNLVGAAPAVLVFYGGNKCGPGASSRFAELAPANRFIVVYMTIPCPRSAWEKRNVDSTGTTIPNDEPYVNAVVSDITRCPGECADPQRIYAAGMSSGGSMTADVMCDSENSPLFRGYMIDSSSLELFGEAPNQQPHCPSSNRNFFAMLALGNLGPDAGLYYDTAPKPHLDVPHFAEWAGARLGCGGSMQQGAVGSPVGSTLTYTYTGPCAYASAGSAAVVALGIQNGGHGWSCQDSDAGAVAGACAEMSGALPQTNGLFTEERFWDFVAAGTSYSQPVQNAGGQTPTGNTPGGGAPTPEAPGASGCWQALPHSIGFSLSVGANSKRAWGSAVALTAAAALLGCGTSTATDGGQTAGARPAPVVHVPSGLSRSGRVPLVIALHPSGGTPARFEAVSGWDRLADRHRFIVAYLGSAAPAWKSPSNVAYIDAEIRSLTRRYGIDPKRVYVTGFSAGAYISYFVACRLSAHVAAIAAVSGAMAPQHCKPGRPVSELTIFGTHDIIPLSGTRRFPAAAKVAALWRAVDRCPRKRARVSLRGPANEQTWTGCAQRTAVALYVVRGGRHAYPGSPKLAHSEPDAQFAASAAIWAFFAAHPSRG